MNKNNSLKKNVKFTCKTANSYAKSFSVFNLTESI